MSVIIEGFDKPKNCYQCLFNNSDCYCNLTKGGIDRDDYDCSVTCPIKELPEEHGKIIKIEDLKYLTDNQIKYLDAVLNTIADGRKKDEGVEE